jgi:hypothetical protein
MEVLYTLVHSRRATIFCYKKPINIYAKNDVNLLLDLNMILCYPYGTQLFTPYTLFFFHYVMPIMYLSLVTSKFSMCD